MVDITSGISKQNVVVFCPKCERYLLPPSKWVKVRLESPELLSICLKRVKGLNRGIRITNAKFLWTEPHSKKLLIELTVRKEIESNNGVIEQNVTIEFNVHNQQCTDCHRYAAKDFWNAVVQIRQKADHKKTLLYLEQILLITNAHAECNNIKQVKTGMDFFFPSQTSAVAFVDFLTKRIPCRSQTSQQLQSHDLQNNTFHYKWTYCVEVVPCCKDDIVCLPRSVAQKNGNFNQICIVQKITQKVRLIDPQTCELAEFEAFQYFSNPFETIASPKHFSNFVVMEIERDYSNDDKGSLKFDDRASMMSYTSTIHGAGHAPISGRHHLVGVWLTKENQLGKTTIYEEEDVQTDLKRPCSNSAIGTGVDETSDLIFTRTHLGYILREGDIVQGFDFRNCNINNAIFDTVKDVPDVLIVRKANRKKKTGSLVEDTTASVYSEKTTKRLAAKQQRTWELQRLKTEICEEDEVVIEAPASASNDRKKSGKSRSNKSGDKRKAMQAAAQQQQMEEDDLEEFINDLCNDSEMAKTIMVRKGQELINLSEAMKNVNIEDENHN